MQSLCLKNAHMKVLKAFLYKFIWNRHYLAAKAPERIKRDIVNTPVKLGGFGMLDIAHLDEGLKCRALGRLLASEHPFMILLRNKVDLNDFFDPKCISNVDSILESAINVLNRHRNNLFLDRNLLSNRCFLAAVGESKIAKLISINGRNSIHYFRLHAMGKRLVKDLNLNDLVGLRRYLLPERLDALENSIRLNRGQPANINSCVLINSKFKDLSCCTSKELRATLNKSAPILEYKLGMNLDINESRTWGARIAKLTSVRHRAILLRVAHGDIYTKDKLNRFGLADNNECPRCGEIENLKHKFIECQYVKQIWRHLFLLTNDLTTGNQLNEDRIKACMGALKDGNKAMLTINAEIHTRILYLKPDQNFLLHPKKFIELALRLILRREKEIEVKSSMEDLLGKLTNR